MLRTPGREVPLWPILIEIGAAGSGAVPTYLVFVLSAFTAGCLWVHRRGARVGIDPDSLVGLYVVAALMGLGGARLLHLIGGEWERFVADPWVVLDPRSGGMAFLGGAAGGMLGGAIYARLAGIAAWKLADVVSVGLMLGLSIGRLGCFFAGCCHGRVCPAQGGGLLIELPAGEVWWTHGLPVLALRFDTGAVAGQLVYPTQLIESVGALGLAWALHRLTLRWRRFDGHVLAAMLTGYGLLRLGVETLRGDLARGVDHVWWGTTWSTGQLSSLALLVAAVVVVFLRRASGVAEEALFEDPVEHSALADDLID